MKLLTFSFFNAIITMTPNCFIVATKEEHTTIVISDGLTKSSPHCSFEKKECEYTTATKNECADALCKAQGYVGGSFQASSNNFCTESYTEEKCYVYLLDNGNIKYSDYTNEARITAECNSECTNGELPNGATDVKGNDCGYFNPIAGQDPTTQCGQYDDDDFKAHKMCCACKNSIFETVITDAYCGSSEEYLGLFNTVSECANACQKKAKCQYFVFSKGYLTNDNQVKETHSCYWEKTESAKCPEGFNDQDNFNFYRMINIVDKANTTEELKEFIQAIEKAGLVEDLKAEGPFTVFAPINAAFEAKKDEMENEDLKKILLRHVVGEKLMPDDIPRGITTKKTAGGEMIDVINAIFPAKNQDTSIVIKSSAGNGIVINQPIEADNGVIHIVNEIF